jgi:ribose transport system substrate-binding protein
MKKLLMPRVIAILLVSLFLVGCSSTAAPAAAEPAAAAVQEAAPAAVEEAAAAPAVEDNKDQRYVMVVLISAHPFWNDIKKGAQDAADQLGVTFEFTGPVEFDAAAQAAQVEQLITTKPAGIILGSYDPSMTESINRAWAAGIPVATFDSDAPDSDRLVFVGPNHYTIGWKYGEYMADLLGGEGEVGVLTVLSQTNLMERVRGVEEYFAQNAPGISVVAIEDNGGDDQVTADKTKNIIQANPEIDGIIVVNATGSGVATAIKELDRVGEIKVVTSDVSDPILQGIKEGAIDTTSYVNIYLEGYYALSLLHDFANGKTAGVPGADVGVNLLPVTVDPGMFFITKDSADVFMSGQ